MSLAFYVSRCLGSKHFPQRTAGKWVQRTHSYSKPFYLNFKAFINYNEVLTLRWVASGILHWLWWNGAIAAIKSQEILEQNQDFLIHQIVFYSSEFFGVDYQAFKCVLYLCRYHVDDSSNLKFKWLALDIWSFELCDCHFHGQGFSGGFEETEKRWAWKQQACDGNKGWLRNNWALEGNQKRWHN